MKKIENQALNDYYAAQEESEAAAQTVAALSNSMASLKDSLFLPYNITRLMHVLKGFKVVNSSKGLKVKDQGNISAIILND